MKKNILRKEVYLYFKFNGTKLKMRTKSSFPKHLRPHINRFRSNKSEFYTPIPAFINIKSLVLPTYSKILMITYGRFF